MGLLLDLLRRWFGLKPQETPRALPAPPSSLDRDEQPPSAEPIIAGGLPWLAPVEPPPAPITTGQVAEALVEAPPQPAVAVEPESQPIVVESTPEPVPVEPSPALPAAIPPPPESAVVAAPPEPIGWADDLASPLREDWGAIDPESLATTADPNPTTAADRRAEAAERRATDIRYLGRGVSEALDDRRGDRARLERLGLPAIDSPATLAERLGISVARLRWLAFHAEVASRVHYVGFEVAKKGGGTRRLSAPHRSLALAQRWILAEIVARLPTEEEAHGFVPGRSIVTNAGAHAGRAVVVNLDLAGFFPSIGWRRVRAVCERAGYSPAIATILALLCTEAPRRPVKLGGAVLHVATGPRGLPQGACTSPGLANQVARRLDRRLGGLAAKLGATYTRYADDLTFSGRDDLDPKVGYLMAQVRRIAASEGFAVNESKTRVLRQNTRQTVTGLVVNDRPGVARAEVRRVRAILHRAKLEGLAAQNRAGHPDFRAWLRGKIAFIAMARPHVGAQLLAAYRAVEAD